MDEADARSQARLVVVLDEIVGTIESLMLSGLTTVSPAIADKFQVAFEHAAKCQLLRLSSNLRLVNQELKRFFDDDSSFSEKRLALFLNRSWQMSRQISNPDSIEASEFSNNSGSESAGQPVPIEELRVAIHGVIKKTVPGVFCALEFRLRRLDNANPHSKPLSWSCVLAASGNSIIVPESLLNLERPQKFKPVIFLQSTVCLRNIHLLEDDSAIRVQLNKDSKVIDESAVPELVDNLQPWSLDGLGGILKCWQPSPLDLNTQPQFEVYLDSWAIDNEIVHPGLDNKIVFPLYTRGKQLYLLVDNNDDGSGQLTYLRKVLRQGRRSTAKPAKTELPVKGAGVLFGLLHFEQGIALLQPLTLWAAKSPPQHLMITEDKSDYAALLKVLN